MKDVKKEKSKRRWVKDTFGSQYDLKEKVGQGGQGIVLHTQYPQVLVKLSKPLLPEQKNQVETKLQWLQRQPLEALNIARPLALIREKHRAGYVMELMDGLVPLKQLLESAQDTGIESFIETGGLIRRIRLMAKLARTLSQLHCMGLAYGDLSPDNIFISQDTQYSEVWLIDCDNICYHSRSSEASVYTPDYGAPEILQGLSGINTYTDSWSFAAIAYQLLTMKHPLKGDLVNDGEPELEEQALRGEFPWVGHSDDNINAYSGGIPDDLVLGKTLRALMNQCFDPGLIEPKNRPTLAEWADAFEDAEKVIMLCENEECNSSFYYNAKQQCNFCEHQQTQNPGYLLNEYIRFAASDLPDGADQQDCWLKTERSLVAQPNQKRLVLTLASQEYSLAKEQSPICYLELTVEGLWIEPASDIKVSLQNTKKAEPISRRMRLKTSSQNNTDFYLHLGDFDVSHPVWRFRW